MDAFFPHFGPQSVLWCLTVWVQAGGWPCHRSPLSPPRDIKHEQQQGLLNTQRSEVKQAAASHCAFPGSDPRVRLRALQGLKHAGASPRRNGHGHVGSGASGCCAGAGEAFPAPVPARCWEGSCGVSSCCQRWLSCKGAGITATPPRAAVLTAGCEPAWPGGTQGMGTGLGGLVLADASGSRGGAGLQLGWCRQEGARMCWSGCFG